MSRRTLQADESRTTKGRSELEQADALLIELEEAMRIGRDKLDDNLIQQPDLFYRVSKQLAYLISKRDASKQYLEVTEAEVDEIVRAEAVQSTSDKKRVTEAEIKAQIKTHRDVITARNSFNELSRQVGQWGALKEAYMQRSYALKEMVTLYVSNYYGDHAPSERDPKERQYRDNRRAMHEERVRRRDD